jgi:pimeloyl-ACP methyl ester carboxylesterase
MTMAETRTYDHDGLRLVGDVYHATAPRGIVLLLHGGGQTRHSWDRTARHLANAGWTAHTLDARGHGDSGWAPDSVYNQDVFVDDLVHVVTALPQPPVLVGASLGGLSSLIAVGESRITARALVLVDIAARVETTGSSRISEFMRARPDGFESLEEIATAIATFNPHRSQPANLDGLRKNVRLHSDGRWHWHWDPAFLGKGDGEPDELVPRERLRGAAAKIAIPTLLVRGAHSDVLSTGGVREWLALVPSSRFIDVSGTGHMVVGDDNDAFTTNLLEFIDAPEQTRAAG